MRIYVANLAKYNQGMLVGKWIELPIDPDDLKAGIQSVLGTDEEFAIHDYESPFLVEEYSNPYQLNEIAELDEADLDRFSHLVNEGYDWAYALEHYEDVTFYNGMDLRAVAEEQIDDGIFGEIPENIIPLIDMDRVANVLNNTGYVESEKGTFYYS